jgi:hypothetical protein
MRAPTEKEKRDFAERIVDTAIVQASESSGLRDWLIKRALQGFTEWDRPNAAELMLQGYDDLIAAFEDIVDPDESNPSDFSRSTLEYQEPAQAWLKED